MNSNPLSPAPGGSPSSHPASPCCIGAPRHPESDSEDSLRHELATMTSHDDWVLAHSFVVASTLLLATGLWLAYHYRSWPTSLHRALFGTASIVSAYVVETVFHLASAVDSDELHHGDAAPVAFTHVGLSIVLYPVTGFAIAYLSARIFATVRLRRKPIALPRRGGRGAPRVVGSA